MSARFDDARLLEWILDPDRRDARSAAQLAADPDAQRRLGELEAFLVSCRALIGRQEADQDAPARQRDTAPLAARVLARTTREDLSWRGDLGLLAGYVGRRLADSRWLQVAAASLLLHVIALPALAFYVFVARPEGIQTRLIPWEEYHPEQPFPEERSEPARDLELPAGPDDPLDGLSEDD